MKAEELLKKIQCRLVEIDREIADGSLVHNQVDALAQEELARLQSHIRELVAMIDGKPDRESQFIIIRELIPHKRHAHYSQAVREAAGRAKKSGERFLVVKFKREFNGGLNG